MFAFKTVIDAAIDILTLPINIFGYNISLLSVAVFCVLASILLGFVFRLFK